MCNKNLDENGGRWEVLLDDERLFEKDLSSSWVRSKEIKMDRSGKKHKNSSRLRERSKVIKTQWDNEPNDEFIQQ